jgi:hypothetical protein
MQDVEATRGFVVVPESERFPLRETVDAIGLAGFLAALPDLV